MVGQSGGSVRAGEQPDICQDDRPEVLADQADHRLESSFPAELCAGTDWANTGGQAGLQASLAG